MHIFKHLCHWVVYINIQHHFVKQRTFLFLRYLNAMRPHIHKKQTAETIEIYISLSIQYTSTLSPKVNRENSKGRIYLILNKILQSHYKMVADCNLHTATV